MTAGQRADAAPVMPRTRSCEPLHLVAVGVAGLILFWTVKALSETDLFWHVPLGHQILESHRVSGAGAGWTIATDNGGWVSSEWLGEVTLAAVQSAFGWHGILWLRLGLSTILIAAVLILVLRTSTARVGAVTMLAVSIPLASAIQERPQLVSLILLTPTAFWTHRVLRERALPNLWLTAPMTLIWAQIHPLWLMLPTMISLAALCRALDSNTRDWRFTRSGLLHGITLLAVGCLTPIGPRALLLPFELRGATATIAEWQPTSPMDPMAWGLLLVGALMVLAWTRQGRNVVQNSELAFIAVLMLFAFMAYRNVLPAMLLMIPTVTARLAECNWARRSTVTPHESHILRAVAMLVMGISIMLAAAKTAALPTFGDRTPVLIAQTLADLPGEHRVLNAYNVSGVLVAFGGPRIRLAVDGRADRWGASYLNDYFDLLSMKGQWRANLAKLHVTDAVLQEDAPIVGELVRDGWTRRISDCSYVLLSAPSPR